MARGDKVLITEGGKPVAMLVPLPKTDDVQGVIDAFTAYSRQQNRTLTELTSGELIE